MAKSGQQHQSEVSKRYAKALFEIVTASRADTILVQLRKIQDLFENPKVKNLVCSPVLSKEEKVTVTEKLIASLSIDKEIFGLIKLLALKDRISDFADVVSSFESISDTQNKVLRGVVQSQQELTAQERKELEKRISDFTGAQLILEYSENPELIGGIKAHVGSYTFDGSLSTQLSRLKEQVVSKS